MSREQDYVSGFLVALSRKGQAMASTVTEVSNLMCHTSNHSASVYDYGTVAIAVIAQGNGNDNNIAKVKDTVVVAVGYSDAGESPLSQSVVEKIAAYGDQFAANLRGDFATVACWPKERRLVAATNRFGTVPLFWSATADVVLACTEIGPCLSWPGVRRGIDQVAVLEMMMKDQALSDRTLFECVKQVPPGSALYAGLTSCKISDYWNGEFAMGPSRGSRKEWIVEASNLTRLAIHGLAPKDTSVLVPISGGLDSRTVLAHLCETNAKIRSFTFGHRFSLERAYARQVVRKLGVRQEWRAINRPSEYYIETAEEGINLTGGMLSPAHFHLFNFIRENHRSGEILFTGFLGDAIVGSHATNPAKSISNVSAREEVERILGHSLVSQEDLGRLLDPQLLDGVKSDLESLMKRCLDRNPPYHFEEYHYVFERQPKLISFINALCASRMKVMSPFANYALADLYMGAPLKLRWGRKLYLDTFINSFPQLAAIPETTRKVSLYKGATAERVMSLVSRGILRLQRYGAVLTRGQLVVPVPEFSENHIALLNTSLRPWLREHLRELVGRDLFKAEALPLLDMPLMGHGRHFHLSIALFRAVAINLAIRWAESLPTIKPSDLHGKAK